MARIPGATFLPFRISAAARRSSIRPLVQEPMKTVSILMSVSFWPGVRPMYSRLRRAASTLPPVKSSGAGTVAVIGSTSSGEVPQVTTGAMSSPRIVTTLSNCAPHR